MGLILFSIKICILSFLAELAYAGYTVCVAKGKISQAMFATAMIAILKGGLVISFVREPKLIPAVALGQVIGTYLILHYTKNWR